MVHEALTRINNRWERHCPIVVSKKSLVCRLQHKPIRLVNDLRCNSITTTVRYVTASGRAAFFITVLYVTWRWVPGWGLPTAIIASFAQ